MGMREVVNEAPQRRRQRCVVPSVVPRPRHGNDQLVPVYWDQTVPVWCEEVGPPSSKRRQQDSDSSCGRRFGGHGSSGGATMCTVEKNEEPAAPQVSFDVITSMYRSSLVEVCYQRCSARGDQGWVLGALLLKKKKQKRIIMRQRPPFAGRCSRSGLSKNSHIASVDHGMSSSNSQCRMNQLRHHRDHPLYSSSMLTTSSS